MNEISSHLCLTNLVNKGFIMPPEGFFSWGRKWSYLESNVKDECNFPVLTGSGATLFAAKFE